MLAPKGGAIPALWVIDPATGATTAVLLDGSGGALSIYETCKDPSTNETIMDVVNSLLTVASLVCLFPGVNVFFCLGAQTAGIFFTVYGILADGAIGLVGVPGTMVGLNIPGTAGRFMPKTGVGAAFGALLILIAWLPTLKSEAQIC